MVWFARNYMDRRDNQPHCPRMLQTDSVPELCTWAPCRRHARELGKGQRQPQTSRGQRIRVGTCSVGLSVAAWLMAKAASSEVPLNCKLSTSVGLRTRRPSSRGFHSAVIIV